MDRGQVEGRMLVPSARDRPGWAPAWSRSVEGKSPRPRVGAALCVGKLVQVGRAEGVVSQGGCDRGVR